MSRDTVWGTRGGCFSALDAEDAPTGEPFVTEAFVSVEETPTTESPELLGGVGQLLDRTRTDLRLSYTVTMRKANPHEIAALHGATVVETTGKVRLARKPGDRPGPLWFQFITGGNGDGEGVLKTIHKAFVVSPPPVSLSDADFSEFTFEIEAIKNKDGLFVDDDFCAVALELTDLPAPVSAPETP